MTDNQEEVELEKPIAPAAEPDSSHSPSATALYLSHRLPASDTKDLGALSAAFQRRTQIPTFCYILSPTMSVNFQSGWKNPHLCIFLTKIPWFPSIFQKAQRNLFSLEDQGRVRHI